MYYICNYLCICNVCLTLMGICINKVSYNIRTHTHTCVILCKHVIILLTHTPPLALLILLLYQYILYI